MIPKKDLYADKHGRLTTDMSKAAFQIAAAGCFLDERTAKRYGITDELVSVDEPRAVRRVIGIIPQPIKETEPEPEAEKPEAKAAEAAPKEEAASPEVEKPKPEAKKPAAQTGAKKK